MKASLLRIYAGSNLGSVSNPLLVALCFVTVRVWMYGIPVSARPGAFFETVGLYIGGLIAILIAFMKVRSLYQEILSEEKDHVFQSSALDGKILQIALFKAAYMILWLYFLFMPVQGTVYEHLLGYFFVFCAIGVSSSLSSAYIPLLFWDIGILLSFALGMTWINRGVEEAPYLAAIFLIFGFYAILGGYKNAKTTKNLVESRQALEKAVREARQATQAKSEFLAMMSHEIRTPMTGILGMIDFMSETELSSAQKSCVDNITQCSKTLLNVLNDVLDMSRIEAGKLAISNVNMDLYGVAENTVKVLENVAEEKKLKLHLNIDANVPRHIWGDPHRIRQSVMNLVNNALKFTEEGYVRLSLSFKNDSIHFAVRDTGIGIGPEKVKKLFNAFSQADNSTAQVYGGSGLGLSITKRLVELMGGKVGVSSETGIGSTFWFDIPYHAPVAEKRKAPGTKMAVEMLPQNVLLVEDNHINQMICCRILEKKGHHVTVANDGETALDMVRKGAYNLILMDCSLPGKSGIETTRQIKLMEEPYSNIPVIALTANGMEAHIRKCHDAGMVDYIVKPYEPAHIYEAMARHVGGLASFSKFVHHDKLKAMQDEMGMEYTASLVQNSLVEAARLLQQASLEYQKRNYIGLMQAVHELRAVGGAIGMQKTQEIAGKIEEACIERRYMLLDELLNSLISAQRSEQTVIETGYLSS